MTALLLAFLISGNSPSLPDVVANVRKAVLDSSGESVWNETLLKGKATFNGVEDKYSLQFQPNGCFLQIIQGPLGQSYGSDGKAFWQIDRSGATRQLAFEDVDRTNAITLLLTDRWLDPKTKVNATLERGSPTDTTYKIHFKPRDTGLDETVRIDPQTWLPVSAEFEIASSKTVVEMKDWKTAGQLKIPFLVKVTNEGLTDIFQINEAIEVKTSVPEIYQLQDKSPTDWTYSSSLSSALETKRASSGHVLVHPRINGVDVGWFILDSGAESMIIDPAAADELHLPKVGLEAVVGVGGTVQEPFRTANTFELGPATINKVTFVEIDLRQLSDVFKVKLSGIVGFDFFRRFIVRMNLAKPSVEVFEPTSFKLSTGSWTKLLFSTGNPAVLASFEGGHQAWFRLDTGANGSVTFHSPAVEQFHLLQGRETTDASMAGVGGSTEAKFGKLAWFELGGKRFEKVDATFSLAKTGAFADRYLAGNIGQDLMEPFVVVFDFGGSRVALVSS